MTNTATTPATRSDVSDVVRIFRGCAKMALATGNLDDLTEAIEWGEFTLPRLTSGDELGHMAHRIEMLADAPASALAPAMSDLVTWFGEQIDRLHGQS